jgi:hypothetical protein
MLEAKNLVSLRKKLLGGLEALRKSEERYRSLFDCMMVGVCRSTYVGKFVDVNLDTLSIGMAEMRRNPKEGVSSALSSALTKRSIKQK